jgi:hypothetical protein
MKHLDVPILDRLLEPVGNVLSPDVAHKLVDLQIDAQTRKQLDKLARKCNEGRLSDQELREYETYVAALDFIAMLQAKARAFLRSSAAAQ